MHLTPATSPDAETDHQKRAECLEGPPEQVGRERVRVECGDEEVQEMDGQGEVRDQF